MFAAVSRQGQRAPFHALQSPTVHGYRNTRVGITHAANPAISSLTAIIGTLIRILSSLTAIIGTLFAF